MLSIKLLLPWTDDSFFNSCSKLVIIKLVMSKLVLCGWLQHWKSYDWILWIQDCIANSHCSYKANVVNSWWSVHDSLAATCQQRCAFTIPLGKMSSFLPVCMNVHYVHAWCLWRPEECISFPRIDLKYIVNCHVGAMNQIWMLYKRITVPHKMP